MIENVEVLCHSSIKMKNKNNIIYIDPFKIDNDYNDADFIFITHDHYDHYSEEDINKVVNNDTIIVVPDGLITTKLMQIGINKDKIIVVEPNKKYSVKGINFETVPAYNINKKFHPKENGWVGYLINLNNTVYYIAGDTDINEDVKKVQCDVALLPVGGTYTMTAEEAAKLAEIIHPKAAIPTHYGSVAGKAEDGQIFADLLKSKINAIIKM